MSTKFPGPYLQTTKAEDPIMIRVDLHHGEIGSRPSGMPKSIKDQGMGIEHVGGNASSKN